MNVGIIGTAGRSSDHLWFTKDKYDRVVQTIDNHLIEASSRLGKTTKDLTIFSGGAAFIDHIAVKLFLTGRYQQLILFLPAFYDLKRERYVETNIKGGNTGKRSNELHELMKSRTGYNSLSEINEAINKGAKVYYFLSFDDRNCALANFANEGNATVYAFTLATGSVPKEGGTHKTWLKLNCEKYHTPLSLFDSSKPDKQKS